MRIKDIVFRYIDAYLSEKKIKVFSEVGKVLSVDESKRICEVEFVSGLATREVFLQTHQEMTKGIVIFPVVGSYVVVNFANELDCYVISYSEIDKILIDNDTNLTVQFNGGDNDGLVKVIELTEKLNALENDINILKTSFKNWVVVASDGGAALKVITGAWFASSLTPTQQSEIENTKIKH